MKWTTTHELKIDVYDEDKRGSEDLKDHFPLGSCTFVIGEIVSNEYGEQKKKLYIRGKPIKNRASKMYSRVTMRVEKVKKGLHEMISLRVACKGLPSMDFLSKSDPYLYVDILIGF